MGAALDTIMALLFRILREPLRRKEMVTKFQALVWGGLDPSLPIDVRNVLQDLAYDLDFFEAGPSVRVEDRTYYGHGRLEEVVRSALNRLQEAGVKVGGA